MMPKVRCQKYNQPGQLWDVMTSLQDYRNNGTWPVAEATGYTTVPLQGTGKTRTSYGTSRFFSKYCLDENILKPMLCYKLGTCHLIFTLCVKCVLRPV